MHLDAYRAFKNVNAIGFQLSLRKKAILNPKQNTKIILQYAKTWGKKTFKGPFGMAP
jgi:hypothetical protein